MKYLFLIAGLLLPAILICAENTAKEPGPPKQLTFNWDLLWAGSWEEGKTLHNRGDFKFGLTPPGLLLRGQAIDRRTLNFELDPPWGDLSKTVTNASLGLYHKATGSRLLYGILDEWGLPARIRSPWIRSAPYTENHKPVMADMRTAVSSTKEPEAYLYLSSPRMVFFEKNALPLALRGFASGQLKTGDTEGNFFPAFSGGLETLLGKNTELLLEGFYTGAQLPARSGSAWFCDPPPLPERDFRLGAAALMLNTPYVSFSSDWAWSETFAWGKGLYGNFALRLGNKPWRFSLAGDGASVRFSDRGGATADAGFRLAAKGEYFWPRSGLLRLQSSLRSPGLDEGFNRGGFSAYFRPSAPTAAARRNKPNLIRFSRSSLGVSRDARNPEKTADTLNALAGFNFGSLSTVLSFSLHSLSSLDGDSGIPPLFEPPFFENFDSFKVSGQVGWKPLNFRFGSLDLRAALGYTIRAKKDNFWEPSLNCSFRPGKWGRIGLRIASTDFPEKWNYTLSWRFTANGEGRLTK